MIEHYQTYRWKAFALIAVLVSVYMMFAVLIPKAGDIIDVYNYNRNLEYKINSVDDWQALLADYNDQQQLLENVHSKLFVSMPRNDEISAIVGLIFSRGRKTGIKIHRITPIEPEQRTGFTEISLLLKAAGSFHQMLKFINELEQTNHLVRLNRVTLSAGEQPPHRTLETEIQLSFVVIQKNRPEDVGHE
ncbi:MAG: type 4a pilus biogenesis protein PilO [Balneolaceae bacterium]